MGNPFGQALQRGLDATDPARFSLDHLTNLLNQFSKGVHWQTSRKLEVTFESMDTGWIEIRLKTCRYYHHEVIGRYRTEEGKFPIQAMTADNWRKVSSFDDLEAFKSWLMNLLEATETAEKVRQLLNRT
jgi:hypothetical protein